MKQPRFSIITIALNNLAGLRETAASVDEQSFPNFEWLVVDGGSTDGTVEFLKARGTAGHPWISERDRGLYDAMNKGLNLASGEYVVFMNSSDRFADREVLAKVDRSIVLNQPHPDFLFGDAYEESASGELFLKPARSAKSISRGMFTHHQAMIYSRKIIGDTRYDQRFRLAADYHFTSRLLAKDASICALGFPVCVFKRGGLSENIAEVGRRENLVVQKEVLGLSLAHRAYNYFSLLASAFLRSRMRFVYDRVRYRQVASNS